MPATGSFQESKVVLKWYGPKVLAATTERLERNLTRAAEWLKTYIQKSMKKGGGGLRRGRPVRRSQPGEPPFVQTGRLRQSIFVRRKKLARHIGVAVEYGIILELGGRHVAPRPFLRPAIEKNKERLKQMISAR